MDGEGVPNRGQAWILEVVRQEGGATAMPGFYPTFLEGCVKRGWVALDDGLTRITDAGLEALTRFPGNPRPT